MERIEQNYADFEDEMFDCSAVKVYFKAQKIVDVKFVYNELTTYDFLEALEAKDCEYFLNFYNPLEMIAHYWRETSENGVNDLDNLIRTIANLLVIEDNYEEKYITMDYAEKLRKKYGDDVNVKKALVKELAELSAPNLRLLKSAGYDVIEFALDYKYDDDDFDYLDLDYDDDDDFDLDFEYEDEGDV